VPKIKYTNKKIRSDKQALIATADQICSEYADQGLTLTLRQLYYQFVARDILPNQQDSYDKLGDACSDGRMLGLLDWDHLVDRTRGLRKVRDWDGPRDLLDWAAEQYQTDLWSPQHQRVEVWIEKDAAIGVIEQVCNQEQVPFFSCRGYTSSSEMWKAAQRVGDHLRRGSVVTILHIGDHDPSGLDMTRDIKERLAHFVVNDWVKEFRDNLWIRNSAGAYDHMRSVIQHLDGPEDDGDYAPFRVRRIALNLDQIQRYAPPPNPAKRQDARYRSYYEATGLSDSWELDALAPEVLADLIRSSVRGLRDQDLWDARERLQEEQRGAIREMSENYSEVIKAMRKVEDSSGT
jgi:hypothetical protein